MSRPDWWETNEAIREELELPKYEPPRFADDVYTYEVIPALEAQYACTIRLIGINTTYPEAWELRVDGRTIAEIDRHRDARGNTVYGLTANDVKELVRVAATADQ